MRLVWLLQGGACAGICAIVVTDVTADVSAGILARVLAGTSVNIADVRIVDNINVTSFFEVSFRSFRRMISASRYEVQFNVACSKMSLSSLYLGHPDRLSYEDHDSLHTSFPFSTSAWTGHIPNLCRPAHDGQMSYFV